ncbi:hypothetical protein ACH492_28205 [Streptomyces sp. NPDC019443]|uniref:hypothetical protein n=1 Tax=Streptomyces sp. NPDC019443 TaxID=3365061 RepID=UPI00379FB3B0
MPPISRPGELPGRSEDIASLNPQLVALARELILQDLDALRATNGSGPSPKDVEAVRDYVARLDSPSAEPSVPAPRPGMGPAGDALSRSAYEETTGIPGRPGDGPGNGVGMGQAQGDPWSLSAVQELVARMIREFLREPAQHAPEERYAPERPQDRFLGRYENEHEGQVATMAQAMEIALSGNSLLREMYEQGQLGRTRGLIEYADTLTQAASAEGAGHATGEAKENVRGARRDEASPEAEHEIAGLRSPTTIGTWRDSVLSYFDPSLDDRRDSFLSDDSVRGLGNGNFSQDMSSVARTRSSSGGAPETTVDGAASTALDPMAAAAASRSPGAPANLSGVPDVPRLPVTYTPRVPSPPNAPGSPGSSSPRGH